MAPRKRVGYPCPKCGKEFSSSSKRTRHRLEVHETAKAKFQCSTCRKSFQRKENYLKHLNNPNIHLICPECARADFKTRKDLLEHVRSVHTSYTNQVRADNALYRENRVRKDKNSFSRLDLLNLPEEDPVLPSANELDIYPLEYRSLIESQWGWVKTKYKKRSVSSTFSLRFSSGNLSVTELESFLKDIHQIQRSSYKINFQFGYVYRLLKAFSEPGGDSDEATAEYSDPHYFIPQKPSVSNPNFLPELWTVAGDKHLKDLIERMDETDILEHLNLRRPNTKYIVELVTNVMVYVYQLDRALIGCSSGILPRYLRDKKSVLTMFYRNENRKEIWDKPHCLFRCLAASGLKQKRKDNSCRGSGWMREVESRSEELFLKFCKLQKLNPLLFTGAISLRQLRAVEEALNFKIHVYELAPKKLEPFPDNWQNTLDCSELTAVQLRRPSLETRSGPTVFLDLWDCHFSLIKNIDVYASTFLCGVNDCRRLFNSRRLCRQHQDRCTGSKRKVRCFGGGYEPYPTLFERLEMLGVTVKEADRYMDLYATYDCEALTVPIPIEEQAHGQRTAHEAELTLASVSVCSSVPGYRDPKFMVSNGNPQELVSECVDYLLSVGREAQRRLQQRYSSAFDSLSEMIRRECDEKHMEELISLEKKLSERTRQLHVFGWNSRGFDVPLMRQYLFTVFRRRGTSVKKMLKKCNSYLLLATEHLKFMDMQALICPTASYANWLKSLGLPHAEKSHFPFSWFDNLEKLKQTCLPERSHWRNDLKNQDLSDADWKEVQRVWNEEGMRTMEDFLAYYNNKDVTHFVDGVELQRMFWIEQGICMVTEGVSLSGLALRLFNNHTPSDVYFSLPRGSDYRYIRQLRKSVCGGLSQTYHRFHLAGVTRIRNGPNLCQKIVGYDFNSLYLAELGQSMPVGVPYEWKPSRDQNNNSLVFRRNCLLPNSVSLMELEFLSFESWKRQTRIKHYLSAKRQYQVPGTRYRADGFLPPNLLFEFQGCHVHGHQFSDPGCSSSSFPQTEDEESLFQRWCYTKDKIACFKERGYTVCEMTSCEWERRRKNDPDVKKYLEERFYPKNHRRVGNTLRFNQMMERILTGDIFGLVMVDIETPLHLRDHFKVMQPLILNRMVERADLGPLMEQYCINNDTMKKPRRVLAQAYAARNIVLITPLLQWYVTHGLSVQKIHWVRQFKDCKAFKSLVDKVIEYRSAADKDPSMSLQGESMKLGNSVYGKTLECGANYSDVRLVDDAGLSRAVERNNFRSSEYISDQIFEVETGRRQYTEDKPLIVGVFILQYSKLRMLRFLYDFLDKYLTRGTWQSVLMDTDSMYLALSSSDLDSLVSDDRMASYMEDKQKFMVCSPQDKRTPGLLKQEWMGDGVISLAPKTYICFNRNDETQKLKRSHKGVQAANDLSPQHYYDVLQNQKQHTVTNRGIWYKDGRFVKYSQQKSGLPYLITKMKTEQDGITLSPLDEPRNGVDAILEESDFSESSDEECLESDDCSAESDC